MRKRRRAWVAVLGSLLLSLGALQYITSGFHWFQLCYQCWVTRIIVYIGIRCPDVSWFFLHKTLANSLIVSAINRPHRFYIMEKTGNIYRPTSNQPRRNSIAAIITAAIFSAYLFIPTSYSYGHVFNINPASQLSPPGTLSDFNWQEVVWSIFENQ